MEQVAWAWLVELVDPTAAGGRLREGGRGFAVRGQRSVVGRTGGGGGGGGAAAGAILPTASCCSLLLRRPLTVACRRRLCAAAGRRLEVSPDLAVSRSHAELLVRPARLVPPP